MIELRNHTTPPRRQFKLVISGGAAINIQILAAVLRTEIVCNKLYEIDIYLSLYLFLTHQNPLFRTPLAFFTWL